MMKYYQKYLNYQKMSKENVNTCCAITMEPDEVLVLISKLKEFIEEI